MNQYQDFEWWYCQEKQALFGKEIEYFSLFTLHSVEILKPGIILDNYPDGQLNLFDHKSGDL